jgi:hypothetical protein
VGRLRRLTGISQENTLSHSYIVHQSVRLLHPRIAESTTVYEITRLMPADETGEVSYRVKLAGGLERVVREGQITPR